MTGFTIKIFAMFFMLIDHLDVSTKFLDDLIPQINIPLINVSLYYIIYNLGRLAFPLFAFLIAEGCKHTSDIKKYMKRLLLFAFISEMPYEFALTFGRQAGRLHMFTTTNIGLNQQNVFFTLFFGVLSVYLYEKLIKKNYHPIIRTLPVIIIGLFAAFINTDYGIYGVLFIFLFYIAKDKKKQLLAAFIMLTCLYLIRGFLGDSEIKFVIVTYIVSCLSMFFIWMYNGKRGPNIKWVFYWFYPIHLTILAFIREIILQ